jgi:hypothetical protein
MSPNNFQRLIDQHPSLFVVLFPVYFMTLWLLVSVAISCLGGWNSLSQIYRVRVPFRGRQWPGQSGQMRWLVHYNRVLTLGANERGLYLSNMFLFRFMHPPLLIPWAEIKVQKGKQWFFDYVIFTMGSELAIPLRIRAKLAERLKNEAGNYWPIEQI